jgi:hypothetical protein
MYKWQPHISHRHVCFDDNDETTWNNLHTPDRTVQLLKAVGWSSLGTACEPKSHVTRNLVLKRVVIHRPGTSGRLAYTAQGLAVQCFELSLRRLLHDIIHNTWQVTYVQRNIEVYPCNHCCSVAAIHITRSKSVFVAWGCNAHAPYCHFFSLPVSAVFFHII